MSTTKKVVIIDYGLGNIYSINQACFHLGYTTIVSADPKDIQAADSLILPGVGAFKIAMTQLENKNLIQPILDFVKTGKPMMGICLGMQLLCDSSEEFGLNKGLGLIPGYIKKFPSNYKGQTLRVPNIGWNKIIESEQGIKWKGTPLSEIEHEDFVYFLHSYYAEPIFSNNILSSSCYNGFEYCSAVNNENVFGFQFHPEKSGNPGLSIIKNFLKL